MAPENNCLDVFHPVVVGWFRERVGEPTEAQRRAWPAIAAGRHVLLVAPTGSGKTLAAFLAALDRLACGALPGGAVRVLYVSPLKALGTDVRRNLLGPLEQLRTAWREHGEAMPEIRVETRSGDTPAEERARMARRPPEILVTTPESLNILLTSRRGRAMLSGVAQVILDEVHAVAGSKRGVHLITAVERLARVAGEFQRIALSATIAPAERIARWVGGVEPGPGGEPGRNRRVDVLLAVGVKRYDLGVSYPRAAAGEEPADADGVWRAVVGEIGRPLRRNRSTLVFANSRRTVEKLTRLVNEAAGEEIATSHHGSLSREVRSAVEDRLKAGALRGVVATNSLELGIDVGALDEVLLVQTPPSVSSAVQRIGRAGHAVGAVSRGRFVPLVPRDLLAAAVVARAVADGAVEPVAPLSAPLDVLAQVLVSLIATEPWPVEELWKVVRCADPYRDLSRRQFDLVLDMLAGRYASARLRHLRPLVSIDGIEGTVRGRPGAERLVYLAGGTIPDRGYFHLRRDDTGAVLGELDEEFVWERSVGDTFTLGVQAWRIERITHNDVFASPARGRSAMAPFWRAEERARSFELSERIAEFLEGIAEQLDDPALAGRLEAGHFLDRNAAAALLDHLRRQRAAVGCLPHRHCVVAERITGPHARGEGEWLVIHTLWGGKVNRPLAVALQAAWRERHGVPLEVIHDDDCLAVSAAGGVTAAELFSLVDAANLERRLRARLESSGLFGARFREAAGCALLLPREGFRRRTPLWLSRQRAKELLEAVSRYDDFPLLIEAWRSCLQDDSDLPALARLLDEIRDGRIRLVEVRTDHPSPFAAGVAWKRTNELMYEDDVPSAGGPTRLREELIREVSRSAHLRPRIGLGVIGDFRRKVQRTWPGYAPTTADALLETVTDRGALPLASWRDLAAAVEREAGTGVVEVAADRLLEVTWPGRTTPSVVAAATEVPRLLHGLGVGIAEVGMRGIGGRPASEEALAAAGAHWRQGDSADAVDPLAELVAELLRFEGPVSREWAADVLGLEPSGLQGSFEALADAQRIILGDLSEGGADEVCDAENHERLLRLVRVAGRPSFETIPASALPLFLAQWQRLGCGEGIEGLRAALERLFGLPAPAAAWEEEILPARLDPYFPEWLDALLADTDLVWMGCGKERVAFALAAERELFGLPHGIRAGHEDPALPPDEGRWAFADLARRAGLPTADVAESLWRQVWSGAASCDGFAPIRRGVERGFAATGAPEPPPGRRRGSYERWRSDRPFEGRWYRVPVPDAPSDSLEGQELDRDRVRVLLDRYGVLFRELLDREPKALSWGRLFRTLRLMELSGEVITGQFFAGVAGPQFASTAALARLRDGLPEDMVVWLGGADPASSCGLAVAGLPAGLPRRHSSAHVVFHGTRLVVVSERCGRELRIEVGADHPLLDRYLSFLKTALTRRVRPVKAVTVETINGEPAAASGYREALAASFHVVRDRQGLRLMRRY
ncbi:MAG: DEAD/DEAH box helicase [Acidobacteriota bacterium]